MKALLSLALTVSLYAEDISALINKAYTNNPTLQKLKHKSELSDYDIANSDLYKNPVLSIGVNDINLDEPIQRDIEAMQAEYITISQEFTDSDKLHFKQEIEKTNKKISLLFLEEQKDRIVKNIYQYYINYEQLRKKIQLNMQKIDNIKKISDYHTNHIQNKKAFQEILNNDLNIDKLNLQVILDQEKQKQILISLGELVGEEVSFLEPLTINIPTNEINNIQNHKLLLIEKENIEQKNKIKELANENLSSDYTISAGYYRREKFDDYMNVAIKFPLNIYGKEKNDLKKAYKQIDIANNSFNEMKNSLEKKYAIELSKQQLSTKSIEYINKIKENLLKEKELIVNKNNIDSLIEVLVLDNKLIDNEILKIKYEKNLQIANIELNYLSSNIQRLTHE